MADGVRQERIELTAVDKFSQVIGQAQAQFKDLGSSIDTLKGALAAVGVTVGAGAMVQLYNDVLKATAALDHMATQTGASVEGLSKIQTVAKIGGEDFNGVADAMGKMIKGLKGTNDETQAASYALKFLGVQAKDSNGHFRDSADILQDVAKALAKYEDGGNKVALVQDLLGKGGAQYLALLKDMASEGDQQAKTTAAQAAVAEAFEKNVNRLKMTFEDTRRELVNNLTPALLDYTNRLLEAMKIAGNPVAAVSLMASTGTENIGERLKQIQQERSVIPSMTTGVANFLTMGFTGLIGGIKDTRLDQEEQYLKYVQRQQALKLSGAGSLDARDLQAQAANNPLPNDYQSPDLKGAASEAKLYISTLQKLEDELGKYNGLTEQEKIHNELVSGSLQKLTPQHGAELEAIAKLIDKKKQDADAAKSSNAAIEAQIAATQHLDEAMGALLQSYAKKNSDLKFDIEQIKSEAVLNGAALLTQRDQIRLASEVNLQREIAIELRKLELDYDRQSAEIAADEALGLEKKIELNDQLTASYEAQKKALPDLLAAKAAAQMSNDLQRAQVDEFKQVWSNVENLGKQAFTAIFSHGKDAMASLGQAIKASVIDLLYELTVHKWIINIGASLSGSVANGALGSLFSSGSGGGFPNPTSFLNSASSLSGLPSYLSGGGDLGAFLSGSQAANDVVYGVAGPEVGGALGALGPIGLGVGALALLGAFGGDGPTLKSSELSLQGNIGHLHFEPVNVNGAGNVDAHNPAYAAAAAQIAQLPVNVQKQLIGKNITTGPTDDASGLISQWMSTYQGVIAQGQAEDQMRSTIQAAQDPIGYWAGQVAKLSDDLHTSAHTIDDWRKQFLAALDDTITPQDFAKWQALGDAITNASNAAGTAASSLTPSNFVTRVDYRRALLSGGAANSTDPAVTNELSMIRVELQSLNTHAARTARIIGRAETDGLPVRGVDPTTPLSVTVS